MQTLPCHAEFPFAYNVPNKVVELIVAGHLADRSWHNDVCPSFSPSGTLSDLILWCEHPDPDLRESGGRRFFVTLDGLDDPLIETDDLDAALAVLLPAGPAAADAVEKALRADGRLCVDHVDDGEGAWFHVGAENFRLIVGYADGCWQWERDTDEGDPIDSGRFPFKVSAEELAARARRLLCLGRLA